MATHGIADTLVNRERATAELMRARADMLLAAPMRYPEAEGLGPSVLLQKTALEPEIEVAVTSARPEPKQVDLKPVAAFLVQKRSDGHTKSDSDEWVGSAALPSPARFEIATPAPLSADRPHGVALAILEFDAKCTALINSKRTWEKKTAQDVRIVVQTLPGYSGNRGH